MVAVFVAQVAWILATPPFRGSDEFDHAFRAAGVASGQWHLTQEAKDGRGLLVWVPADLVKAAGPQCAALPYTLPDNCRAVQTRGDEAQIATSSALYNPLFYWAMGTVAKPFHGASALYAMRLFVAALCALLIGLGAGLMSLAGRGRWVTLGLLTAITPQVTFSASLASPNGVEIALGFVLWASLIALEGAGTVRRERALLVAAIAAALPLSFLRPLGPLWILGIVLGAAALRGWPSSRELLGRQRTLIFAGVVVVGAGTAWALEWSRIAAQFTVPDGATVVRAPVQWVQAFYVPRWMLQMVGAFPFRDVPAPIWTYPLAFMVIGLLTWGAWRRSADRRRSRILMWMILFWLLVPIGVSLVMMSSAGAFWQGRYELPLFIGILPVCGLLLDEADFAPQEGSRLIAIAGAALVVVNVACVIHLQQLEQARSVSAGDSGWVHPAAWVTGAVMLLACAAAALLAGTTSHRPRAAASVTANHPVTQAVDHLAG